MAAMLTVRTETRISGRVSRMAMVVRAKGAHAIGVNLMSTNCPCRPISTNKAPFKRYEPRGQMTRSDGAMLLLNPAQR